VREVLVPDQPADLGGGEQDERRLELRARLGKDHVVEVRERDDQANVVLPDEPRERRDVAPVADGRNERLMVGVVERGGQPVRVGHDRGRARARELGHDVDTLAGAGEEHCRHRREA